MPSPRRATRALPLLSLVLLALAACEKPSAENIDKWRYTEKGPEKLGEALRNRELGNDLRARAAAALFEIDRADDAEKSLAGMNDGERDGILGQLLPMLWNDAKVAENVNPTPAQVTAKDALFKMRGLAGAKQRTTIDGYLVDWFGGAYEFRAKVGSHQGPEIVRAIGARAAPKLIAEVKDLLAHADQPGGKVLVVPSEVLDGVAFTGAPEATEMLLDLVEGKQIPPKYPDDSLGTRAMQSLGVAYLDEKDPLPPGGLVASTERLKKIAASTEQAGENSNIAFQLLAATGKDNCLKPLADLARHKEVVRMWQAVQKGIKCGGADAIVPMSEALPTDRDYEQGIIAKYFWDKIVALGPAAAPPARALLESTSWVARLTGIEVLDKIGTKSDAEKIRKLAKDTTKLKGYDPKKKTEPTLGAEASTVADRLEKRP